MTEIQVGDHRETVSDQVATLIEQQAREIERLQLYLERMEKGRLDRGRDLVKAMKRAEAAERRLAECREALRDLLDTAHEPPGSTQRYYNARGAALTLMHVNLRLAERDPA